jgi:hypothetical protein
MQQRNKTIIFGAVGVALVVLVFVMIGWVVSLQRQLTDATRDKDSAINIAVAQAKEEQRLRDQDRFEELERATTYDFRGPDDYGALAFRYPRAWALYVQSGAQGGDYSAVFYPRLITAGQAIFALRVQIVSRSYDSVLQGYNGQVTSGRLTSSVFKNDLGAVGTRFDGEVVGGQAGGAVVVIRIRDKTAIIQTDTEIFKAAFNEIVLPSIIYNP